MPNMNQLLNRYDPIKELPALAGKIIFVTGGTAGIGRLTVSHLARHNPEHIYFTGRNTKQAESLIAELKPIAPKTTLTFIECDFSSLESVKTGMKKFKHSHLDILINNAGVMALPPKLSKDSYEVQFAINHLAHFLITTTLVPFLLAASTRPSADVRIVTTTSLGFRFGVISPISYPALTTVQDGWIMGPWMRYGRSKYANVLMAHHLAKLYPQITSVSVHPGVTDTELIGNTRLRDRLLIWSGNLGAKYFTSEEGALNQLWLAAGMEKSKVRNGGLYLPVGVDGVEQTKDIVDLDQKAEELWVWSEKAVNIVA